jgi:hypothetical protein
MAVSHSSQQCSFVYRLCAHSNTVVCFAVQVMADVASFTGAATVSLMLVSKYIFQVRGCSCVMQVEWHFPNKAIWGLSALPCPHLRCHSMPPCAVLCLSTALPELCWV